MDFLTLVLWTLGVAGVSYTLGWRTRDRQKQKRADDLRELRIMLTGRVIDAEVELAREVA